MEWLPAPALGSLCPHCGFERREGDAHMVYFDPPPSASPSTLPTWGCGISIECRSPNRLALMSSEGPLQIEKISEKF